MSLIETGRRIENGVTAIDYELKTAAVPLQKGVTLVYYPGGAIKEDSAVEVDIDEGGQVVHPDTGEPFIASLSDFAKGQWFLFGLSNADESIRVFAKGVPFPIASRGENGCQVTVELGDDKGEFFAFYGEGFIPNETVRQTSDSEGEILEDTRAAGALSGRQ
jgi:hypothetical protein